MQFRTYRSIIDQNYKVHGKKLTRKDATDFLHSSMLRIDPDLGTINTRILIDEWQWERTGRKTIFVDSATLPEMVYSIPIRGGFDHILPRWKGIRAFAFPNGAKVNGVELPGALFSFMDGEERHRLVDRYLETYCLEDVHLSSRDMAPAIRLSSNVNQFSYHTAVPLEDLNEMLSDPDWLDRHKIHDILYEVAYTEKERLIQSTVIRVVLGIIAYATAFPEALREGLPKAKPKELGKIVLEKNFNPMTLTGPSAEHSHRAMHFRQGHFRVLANQRFKRDENGQIRVVYVREAIVGGKLEAQTVEEIT